MRQSIETKVCHRKIWSARPNSYQVAAPGVGDYFPSRSRSPGAASDPKKAPPPPLKQTTRLENLNGNHFSRRRVFHETLANQPHSDAGMKWIVMSIEKECADRLRETYRKADRRQIAIRPRRLMNLSRPIWGGGGGEGGSVGGGGGGGGAGFGRGFRLWNRSGPSGGDDISACSHRREAAVRYPPDLRLMDQRRGQLNQLPHDLRTVDDLAADISTYLVEEGYFSEKVWQTRDLSDEINIRVMDDPMDHRRCIVGRNRFDERLFRRTLYRRTSWSSVTEDALVATALGFIERRARPGSGVSWRQDQLHQREDDVSRRRPRRIPTAGIPKPAGASTSPCIMTRTWSSSKWSRRPDGGSLLHLPHHGFFVRIVTASMILEERELASFPSNGRFRLMTTASHRAGECPSRRETGRRASIAKPRSLHPHLQ